VGYVAMRVIGAPDVFPANDAAVRNGILALDTGPQAGERPPGVQPADFTDVSPWRSYATMHLWRAAAMRPQARPRRQAESAASMS
jgi:AraC family transcriptional regulator of adaptative response / DNA-3-methyladenine glycosylase II